MSDQYYVDINGSTAGPFSPEDLKNMYLEGTISNDTLFTKPGAAEWSRLALILPIQVHVAPPASQTIVATTKNTISLALGIIAVVVGVLALLVGWIPLLGLFAIPAAVIGLVLAGVGVLFALLKRRGGAGMPLLGCAICVAAIVLPILFTGGTASAISKMTQEAAKGHVDPSKAKGDEDLAVKTAYIQQHLSLYDVQARFMDAVLDGKVPGVLFKLRNAGDRNLEMVEVTVLFKDASGAVIHEENYTPVRFSGFSLQENRPLKAGYIWQMESGKFYAAKSVPTEWKEGAVEAKISDIRFAK